MTISPGDIVYSTAGRDSGSCFVVIAVEENFVFICDGKIRKTDKPKKKKVRHIKSGCGHSDFISEKLKNSEIITNRELKRELRPYVKL